MKPLKIETKINNTKYLLHYRYQNMSFPLFAFRVYRFKLFGIYWIPVKIKGGSLYPKECTHWNLEHFELHGIDVLTKNLNDTTKTDTENSIKNFKKLTK